MKHEHLTQRPQRTSHSWALVRWMAVSQHCRVLCAPAVQHHYASRWLTWHGALGPGLLHWHDSKEWTQDSVGSATALFHKPCHSSDGKMKIELQSSDPKWTLWHYHNKLKIPNLVTFQWQAKRKLKRMKAHTIIQRTYNSSLYFSRDKACIMGGPLVVSNCGDSKRGSTFASHITRQNNRNDSTVSPITHWDFSKSMTMRYETIRLWNCIRVENHHALRGSWLCSSFSQRKILDVPQCNYKTFHTFYSYKSPPLAT